MANVKNIFPCLVFQVLPGAFTKTGHTFVRAQWFIWEMVLLTAACAWYLGAFPPKGNGLLMEEESWLWLRLSR